jgi:hypothetical protein
MAAEPAPAVETPAQPTYQEPQPQYQQPVYQPTYIQPQPKMPPKAMKFIGMGLSIEGLFTACVGAFYSFIFSAVGGGFGDGTFAGLGFIYALIFAMFSLPGSIIGMIFSKKFRNAGDTSAPTKIGKALGLAGIIVCAASIASSIFMMGMYL